MDFDFVVSALVKAEVFSGNQLPVNSNPPRLKNNKTTCKFLSVFLGEMNDVLGKP